jgi:protein SCO1/2
MNRRAMTNPIRALAALLLPIALAACGGPASQPAERPPLEGAALGGPFTLVDKTGHPVHWDDFAGKYRIVYFGYSFCPDVCPTDLQKLMQAFALFAKGHRALANQVQPIFITIDPARDTPKVVGEYAAAFSPRLLGLTGSQAQVDAAADAFKVYRARGKDTAGGGYVMDHQATAFLMGRKGEPIALLPTDITGEAGVKAIAAELAKWVK